MHLVMGQNAQFVPASLFAAAIALTGTGLAIGDSAKSVSQLLLAVAALCFVAMALTGASAERARARK